MSPYELDHAADYMPCTDCGALEHQPCKPTCPTQKGKE